MPGLILYGGPIAPGRFKGKDVTVGDVYEAIGANAAGRMSDADLQEGDYIIIDIEACRLNVELSDAEITARLANWKEPVPHYTSGVFAKYAALVSSASEGAFTRPNFIAGQG